MVNPDILESKILKLREYLKILQGMRRYSLKELTSDALIRGSSERYLQLAIECLIDIGNHIISDQGFKKAEDYREIFLTLGEEGILPKAFARRIAPMAGFRNILVHDYADIDYKKFHAILRKRLADFEKFVVYISRYLS